MKVLSDNRVDGGCEDSGTQYLFIEIPFEDGKAVSDEEIRDRVYDRFSVRVTSPYDCSGQWFTYGISSKVIDVCNLDNVSTIAVIINWGRDV